MDPTGYSDPQVRVAGRSRWGGEPCGLPVGPHAAVVSMAAASMLCMAKLSEPRP